MLKPGQWMWAKFERANDFECTVRVAESDEATAAGKTPPSLQVLGLVMRQLHLAMGGHPEHSEGFVNATDFANIAIPGGRVQSIKVSPNTTDAGQAREAWTAAWPKIIEAGKTMFGVLGAVEAFDGPEGKVIEMTFGPANVFAKIVVAPPAAAIEPPQELKPKGPVVEMSATLKPSARFVAGN